MSKGKRYDTEPKLNFKKVFAVVITIIVIIMFVVAIKTILKTDIGAQKPSVKYYSMYVNEKWGVINSEGTTVVEANYDEMVVVPSAEKPVFICTYDVNYENGTYKTKAINETGTQIFTDYSVVEAIENYDIDNNVWYENNVLKVKKDGKYGIIDLAGNPVLPCEYDDIYSLKGYENNIVVVKGQLMGLVDNSGNKILDVQYSSIEEIIIECSNIGKELNLTVKGTDSEKPSNIGDWYISEKGNVSYFTK